MILWTNRLLRMAFIIVFSLQVTSCATEWVVRKENYIHEEVSGFYITADRSMLAVTGKQNHYIFDLDASLRSVLTWGKREVLKADFQTFTLKKDNSIEGDYTLKADPVALTDEDRRTLMEFGFVGENGKLVLNRRITGKVYAAPADTPSSGFTTTYKVVIAQDISRPKLVRYALTPVALAADGTLVIGGVALIIVGCTINDLFTSSKCFR